MREVVSNVYLMEGLRVGNVYLLVSGNGLTLLDTGLVSDVDQIVGQLREAGHTPSQLQAIVLTHAHGDHTGGAAALAHRSGARVIAHRDEVPYIEQTRSLRPASLIGRVANWLSDRLVFRTPPC